MRDFSAKALIGVVQVRQVGSLLNTAMVLRGTSIGMSAGSPGTAARRDDALSGFNTQVDALDKLIVADGVRKDFRAKFGESFVLAEAVCEIKTLINTSIEAVHPGEACVSQAGGSMGEIVQAIPRVAAIVGDITSQSTSQADQIRQLAAAIREVDTSTQQNAAPVEETAASATLLEDRAGQLRDAAARLRTATA